MVAGVSGNYDWTSMSYDEILDLEESGVDVPDDVLTEAQQEEAAASTSSTTAASTTATATTITCTASDVNEAADLRAQLEGMDMSLEEMLKQFTTLCEQDIQTTTQTIATVQSITTTVTDGQEQTKDYAAEIAKLSTELQAQANAILAEIQSRQAEKATLQAKIDGGETLTEDEQAQYDTLTQEITTLTESLDQLIASGSEDAASTSEEAQNSADEASSVSEQLSSAVAEGVNDLEVGNETISLGSELQSQGQQQALIIGGIVGAGLGLATFGTVAIATGAAMSAGLAIGVGAGSAAAGSGSGLLATVLSSDIANFFSGGKIETAENAIGEGTTLNTDANALISAAETVAAKNNITIEGLDGVLGRAKAVTPSATAETATDDTATATTTTPTTDSDPATEEDPEKKKETV